MLVLTEEKPSPGSPRTLSDLSFEQRFALSVLSLFALAFVLLGVLFARSGDPATRLPGLAAQGGPVAANAAP